MATRNLIELLRRLELAGVEFVVVGGMAGVMRGAPIVTADLDIVHHRDPRNVRRLLEVLGAIDARFRHDHRRLKPDESHLIGPGHALLLTTLGPVDILGEVAGAEYRALLADSTRMSLDESVQVSVVTLERLIQLKRSAGRPKDYAAIPLLEATLQVAKESQSG